ncbi:alpha/beta hydrolase family protein [Variovorax saccharolyticus]|uniref:alpha/beta hydrolase family protein n=1 Tax=Variovorax saccharolyticus TaxID=3053516 RepID=UPI002578AD22|nr:MULTISPECIES: alpha/beta hydrolase family protein [unclassified Variovorax]MDM0017769.1 alpha/beta hydrolase family protein [Variovorax sp. J22R187]MDM0024741.1 alpha/beta hydrolase family protein [Variovorax sp. J31P216]
MTSFKDEPLLFGDQGQLLGVMTRPTGRPPADVACLMYNFGVTHRVGPRRIQVKLARLLAQQGVPALRFDLSGVGDSKAPGASMSFEEQALGDIKLAIDQIEARFGIRRIIVVGLCSGAIHGFQAALRDPRIVGLLAFDGHRFTSHRAKLERKLRRFLKFPVAQIRHWTERLLGTDRPPDGDLLRTGVLATVMTPDRLKREMESLVARGVSLYLVYSGTLQSRDRDKDQLHALRGSAILDQLRYEFMPNLDHSFTEVAGQDFFLDAVCGWVREIQGRETEPSAGASPVAPRLAASQAANSQVTQRPQALAA